MKGYIKGKKAAIGRAGINGYLRSNTLESSPSFALERCKNIVDVTAEWTNHKTATKTPNLLDMGRNTEVYTWRGVSFFTNRHGKISIRGALEDYQNGEYGTAAPMSFAYMQPNTNYWAMFRDNTFRNDLKTDTTYYLSIWGEWLGDTSNHPISKVAIFFERKASGTSTWTSYTSITTTVENYRVVKSFSLPSIEGGVKYAYRYAVRIAALTIGVPHCTDISVAITEGKTIFEFVPYGWKTSLAVARFDANNKPVNIYNSHSIINIYTRHRWWGNGVKWNYKTMSVYRDNGYGETDVLMIPETLPFYRNGTTKFTIVTDEYPNGDPELTANFTAHYYSDIPPDYGG